MAPKRSLIWTAIATSFFAFTHAQAVASVTVKVDSSGRPCPPDVTVSVLPVHYETFIGSTATITLGPGSTVIINNGPTIFITDFTSTVTASNTVTRTVTKGDGTPETTVQSATSANPGATSGVSSPLTTGPPASTTASPGQPPIGTSFTSENVFPVVSPPAVTPTSRPPILSTVTGTDGSTTMVPLQEPTATIGEGLPSGLVTEVSPTDPVLVVFAYDYSGLDRKRQEADNPEVLGYAGSKDGETADSCAYAQRYFIEDGQFIERKSGAKVNRNISQSWTPFEPVLYNNDAQSTFTFVDGFLNWETADRGRAEFYQCADSKVYAGWPGPLLENCSRIIVGAIKSSICPVDYSERLSDRPQSSTTRADPTPQPTVESSTPSNTFATVPTTANPSEDSTTSSPPAVATTNRSTVIPTSNEPSVDSTTNGGP